MSDETEFKKVSGRRDDREHLNVVFIGHVDAGKSTISGQILLSAGKVDKRTIERYEKEAKEKNRESWYLAYIMDVHEDERARGKTVECGRASFETATKRITLLDAPGHKAYVPSMITGASQADIGCLVISARKGEFEAGYERGGQTGEHIMLAKTLGINKMFVLINKMDEPSVKWSKERYDDIVTKLTDTFTEYGYKKSDVMFFPTSGYSGANIKDRVRKDVCSWYSGKSLFEYLDELPALPRPTDKPIRLPISARYKDRGLAVMGKLESGILKVGDELIVVPNMKKCSVTSIVVDEVECDEAICGENLIVGIKGVDEDDVNPGYVLAPASAPGYKSCLIEAQLMITDLTETIPLLTAGYECVMHLHTLVTECKVKNLVQELTKKGKVKTENPKFLTVGSIGIVRIEVNDSVAVEKFADYPQLGRFTLRDKGKTIAIGKVMRLKPC